MMILKTYFFGGVEEVDFEPVPSWWCPSWECDVEISGDSCWCDGVVAGV